MSGRTQAAEPSAGAHRRAIQLPIAEVAKRLQQVLGLKLTAIAVGERDPKVVGYWARGDRGPRNFEKERRLRDAYRVVELLLEHEGEATVRAWMMGMNPHLDERAPALMLVEEPERVLRAAQRFVEE